MGFAKKAWMIAALACSMAPTIARAEWIEAKSKHFTVYADMPEATLRQRVLELEKFDAALRGLFKVTTDDQATIFLVESLSDVQRMAGNSRVAGFYRANAQSAVGVVPERLPFTAPGMTSQRILYHEYTHHMLLSNTSQFFPGWVTEGLAELFMTAKFDAKGNVIIGEPNASRASSIGGLHRWTVARLLDSDANPPKPDEVIERYSRGWLMVHYLLISNKRPGQFFKFIDLINSGTKPLEAGKTVFGDLDKLETEIERYVRGATFPSFQLDAARIAAPTEVAVRQLGVGEKAIMPYRMTSAIGVNEKTAGPLAVKARVVAANFPEDVAVQRAMAEIEYDANNYDAAEVAANRTLALEPGNVMALVYKGRIAAQRAIAKNDPTLWREARRWFLQANKLNPEYALPFQLFYDSYVAAGVTPPEAAVTGIRRSVVLVPADKSLRLRAGVSLIRSGDLALARTVLAPVAFDPHATDKNPVAKVVTAIDAGSTKDAVMAKVTELKLDRLNEFNPPKPDEAKDEK